MGIVIDLQRRYDIHPRLLPNGTWEVLDYETYEDDPEHPMHLAGHGASICEATTDLLEKIAQAAVGYYTEEVRTSPYEPPVTRRVRKPDPDDFE